MSTRVRPPYDPELQAALDLMPPMPTLSLDFLPMMRSAPIAPPIDTVIAGREIDVIDYTIGGFDGFEIVVSVLKRRDHTGTESAGVFHIHGGGMVVGDRWVGAALLVDWIEAYDVVAATVEYRLAPEYPDPVPVEDCYAGLVWFSEHAEELGFDADRVLVVGGSAGGGLAAGTVLLARDRHTPPVRAQLLDCPMLDDRNETVSSHQYEGVGVWDRAANAFGWSALLGDRAGTDDVSIYAAPGRAQDLSGLPPTYIDAGSAEVFRDEDVAFATRIWEAGGEAELHIWNGGFHGFEVVTTAAVTITAAATRDAWVRRHLSV